MKRFMVVVSMFALSASRTAAAGAYFLDDETTLLQTRTRTMMKLDTKQAGANLTLMVEQVQAAATMLNDPELDDNSSASLRSYVSLAASTLEGSLATVQSSHESAVDEIANAATQVGNCVVSFSSGSGSSMTQQSRQQHRHCRQLEAAVATKCDTWTTYRNSIPQSPCRTLEATDSDQAFTNHLNALDSYVQSYKDTAATKRQDCETARELFSAHGVACSTRQLKFEEDYCLSMIGCVALSTCHESAKANFFQVAEAVIAQAELRKEEYKTIQQVDCFLNLIVAALDAGSTVEEDALIHCAAEAETNHLDITLPEISDAVLCSASESESGPCSEEFISREYAEHSYSDCTPCPPPPPVFSFRNEWAVYENMFPDFQNDQVTWTDRGHYCYDGIPEELKGSTYIQARCYWGTNTYTFSTLRPAIVFIWEQNSWSTWGTNTPYTNGCGFGNLGWDSVENNVGVEFRWYDNHPAGNGGDGGAGKFTVWKKQVPAMAQVVLNTTGMCIAGIAAKVLQ